MSGHVLTTGCHRQPTFYSTRGTVEATDESHKLVHAGSIPAPATTSNARKRGGQTSGKRCHTHPQRCNGMCRQWSRQNSSMPKGLYSSASEYRESDHRGKSGRPRLFLAIEISNN